MKKRLWIYPVLCLVLGGGMMTYFIPQKQVTEFDYSVLWESKRKLPEKVAMDGYLAGNIARSNQDLERAITAYTKVLEKDPENLPLAESTFLLAMIQGNLNAVIPYLNKIQNNKMLPDYAQIAVAYQAKDYKKALNLLNKKHPHEGDPLLLPLIKTWIYAAQNQSANALKILNTLKGKPFIVGYQKILLGIYFKDNDLVQEGIRQIGDNDILAIGYFPLLQKIITETGNWDRSILHQKYQELQRNYPATADLLIQIGQIELTLQQGLAESFYLVSALGADGKFTREESLAANTLALFLDPEKQLSLVWGAELSEGLNLPKVALSYYNRLKFHSATLEFKKASNLMLLGKNNEALSILEQLEKTNKNSVPLLTLLGQAYREENQPQRALEIYNRLIPLLENNPQNKPLMQAYMIRGMLYGPQDSDKMLSDLQHAQKLDPNNILILNDLGYHQLELGQIEEGFDLVQRAHQKKPNDPYILDSLAFGYFKKGQISSALPFAERAVDLMPQSALINAHLGDIYAALGRKREAAFQYKKALDLNTDLTNDLTQELQEKIKEKK